MKDKIDILLIGIGSKSYTRAEVDAVRKFLIKLRPRLLVTRDLIAFSLYKDFVEHSFNGIDPAFYVSDVFKLPKLQPDHVLLNFDHINEPKIDFQETLLVRTHNLTKGFPKH
ncbi:MAG: hypothetical protein DRP01_11105 [Archaeoglobales archaeon]|nr:MAG: hypothetical protein DRP01_11105 [Archaeoglobales archaeon]